MKLKSLALVLLVIILFSLSIAYIVGYFVGYSGHSKLVDQVIAENGESIFGYNPKITNFSGIVTEVGSNYLKVNGSVNYADIYDPGVKNVTLTLDIQDTTQLSAERTTLGMDQTEEEDLKVEISLSDIEVDDTVYVSSEENIAQDDSFVPTFLTLTKKGS